MKTQFVKDDITAGYRNIVDGREYNVYFVRPQNEDNIILDDGEVEDTVELMKKVVWKYIDDTKQIAPILEGKTVRQTCEIIWNFLYNHIQYRLDKKGLEQLRRPCRSWAERKQGIDCDCFSIFVSSILTNLHIPHKFRITMYSAGVYQHVYVIVPTGNEYITIDCVVSRFNYEKPFYKHKDFTMNINGINVAVLSGINDKATDDNVVDMLSGIEGIGEINESENKRFLYEHLVRTRNMIAANPALISSVDYPPAFLEMLDYAIKHWNTPMRDAALENLARNENELNRMNGYSGTDDYELDGLDDLFGFDDELNGKKTGKKGFFKKVGQAVKKGAIAATKLAVRFNPLTITARNGFLLAMKLNLKKMGTKLKWAYATKEQAAAKGVSEAQWQKSKNALAKIEKLFADRLQGKKSALKNAVLKGKAGGLNGIDEEGSLEGLGVLPAAAIAAAIPVITSALKALVDSGAMKKEEAQGIEDEVKSKTSEANASANESDMSSNATGTESSNGASSNASSGADSSGNDDSKDSKGIFGFVKKQPLVAIGGAALGIWGLTKLLGGKKKNANGLGRVPNKRKKNKKQPNKMKSIEFK